MTQDNEELEVSEAQIAAHWKEEEFITPPSSFVAQANMADPKITRSFQRRKFPRKLP